VSGVPVTGDASEHAHVRAEEAAMAYGHALGIWRETGEGTDNACVLSRCGARVRVLAGYARGEALSRPCRHPRDYETTGPPITDHVAETHAKEAREREQARATLAALPDVPPPERRRVPATARQLPAPTDPTTQPHPTLPSAPLRDSAPQTRAQKTQTSGAGIAAALLTGRTVMNVAHSLGVGEDRVRVISRELEAAGKLTACACGKPVRHAGRCRTSERPEAPTPRAVAQSAPRGATDAEIDAALLSGKYRSAKEVQTALHVRSFRSQARARALAAEGRLQPCACGLRFGHSGPCSARLRAEAEHAEIPPAVSALPGAASRGRPPTHTVERMACERCGVEFEFKGASA